MPVGTAEKHLRKSIIHELAQQLGKNQCCRCGLEVEEPDDLAIVHVQEWEEDPDLFWALTNIAFSHATCEAARSGKRQREKKQMSKVEVRVEDPHGKPLPGSRYEGDLYVAGKKGSRYQIRVRNKTNQNVLVVLTVDGRNVITGEPGDHQDSGQVIGPRDTWVFKGWRTSDNHVAAFEFGNKSGSYSAQLGSPENVGVIGCAVFEEEVPEPVIKTVKETTYIPYPVPAVYTPTVFHPWGSVTISDTVLGTSMDSATTISTTNASWDGGGGSGTFGSSGSSVSVNSVSSSASVTPASAPASRSSSRKRSRKTKKVEQRLGTEFGETLNSSVRTVSFERATEDPCEVWVIRYDSLGALREKGIMVRPSERRQETPQAFPENAGYCQPPGGVRRPDKRRYGSR
jgi:hypothetical protein